jgi:hypothetical protein
MDGQWFGHVIFFGRFQKTNQILGGRVFVMMAAVTGIGLLVQAAGIQGELGEHESEGMAMGVSGFANARHPGHVAANAAAKGVNAVHRAVLGCRMAGLAKLIFKQAGMAGDAVHAHFSMFALLPVEILLVAVSGFSARPK